ncbi:uncharacterized protein [Nicotiana tomentosiformis]|uniref:uncharacterized protein n=1 Tax=Nicotiana tomentosiformis TaxID=4098 RepID=UPI00388C7B78
MAGNGDDNVDLAVREAVQRREQAARDADKAAIRDALIIYEEQRGRRIAQNQPLAVDQFGNIARGPRRSLGDYARPVYNQDFWDGLTPASRRTLSNSGEVPLMKKTPEEIVTILDGLSEDANQWPSESAERRRSTGVHQVDANTSVQVYLDSMAKAMQKLTLATVQSEPHTVCDICGRGHPTHGCQALIEEVNAVENYNFNAMGQKHPALKILFLEAHDLYYQFLGNPRQQFEPQQRNQPGLEDLMKAFIVKTDERFEVQGATIQNLEKQVGQIATILSERVPGTLHADTEKNPKETVNAVTLRSGQVLKDPTPIQKDVKLEKESGEQLKSNDDKKKKVLMKVEKKKKEEKSRKEEHEERKHMPALPFPQRLCREKMDKQSERFLDVLKQVHVNLPFTEVISQMPSYARFLKEILTKKRKIEETSVIKLTEHCSAILQNKLPQKKLEKEIGEIRSIPISLQLADQTTLIPEGIVEDVFVRVDKFVFRVDFIVVNMQENKEVLLILGRPFLATGREILYIYIYKKKLMLRVGEETLTFKMDVEKGVQKEKIVTSAEWKVKGSKEKAAVSDKDKCGVYPKKAEKKLSIWMCALVRARGMKSDFDSDPD